MIGDSVWLHEEKKRARDAVMDMSSVIGFHRAIAVLLTHVSVGNMEASAIEHVAKEVLSSAK
jgi:hypothetical protein